MRFVIERRSRGKLRRPQFQARLVFPNGLDFMTSEGYNNHNDLVEAVNQARGSMPFSDVVDLTGLGGNLPPLRRG
jgi:hypothetical protein